MFRRQTPRPRSNSVSGCCSRTFLIGLHARGPPQRDSNPCLVAVVFRQICPSLPRNPSPISPAKLKHVRKTPFRLPCSFPRSQSAIMPWSARDTELFDYLEVFYNGQRRHSALGYLSPRAFERRREQEAVAT